ncbi:Insulin-like growth factor-binding protein 2-A [Triplophysa tibetana]|uniref:Insulin-like growth factor-binding protein 2-A n=1 Tax=Triplophysa tibetana TaxID=1572043 RepID=A0A5A9NT65_9TELE|nr:Insulin-like growth factor-binding protein 2-A [Triplophysa tibetana]
MMLFSVSCSLLLALLTFSGAARSEMVFRCPSCTAERQAACPMPTETCSEIVREPGCGCCPVCARQEGELCGVYTPRCSSGLRCYPKPDSDLPLELLIQGLGRCGRKVDNEPAGSAEPREVSGEVQDPLDIGLTEVPPVRKPTKDSPWKESAVLQHHQQLKSKMRYHKVEDPKVLRAKLSQCQQELDQVLERISKMPFSDNRGPLEDLYSIHIPNCDKKGQYNLKQCKMSVNGHRGECWCVNPHTGRPIPTSPLIRGDPNCNQYFDDLEMDPPVEPQN